MKLAFSGSSRVLDRRGPSIAFILLALAGCDGVANRVDDSTTLRCGFGADLQTDVLHCGACDNACAFDNAEPACVAGACTIDVCFNGFVDLDRRADSGCECVVQDEVCNAQDDDCDGAADEGLTCPGDCTIDRRFVCADSVEGGVPGTLYHCAAGRARDEEACAHGCRDGACLGPPLHAGRITWPTAGDVVPVGPVEVSWENGTARDGEAVETTVFCGVEDTPLQQAAPFGAAEVELPPSAPGARVRCQPQTRFVADPDRIVLGEAVAWRVAPEVATPEIIEVVVEDQANACGRIRVSLQVANRGAIVGKWRAEVAVIDIETGEARGSAELYGAPSFRVAPNGVQSFNIDVDLEAPAPPGAPTVALEFSIVDDEFGFHPPAAQTIALPAVDTGPPRLMRWNQLGPAVRGAGEGVPVLLPGLEVQDQIWIEDDYGVAWAEVSWAIDGDEWQANVPVVQEPRGACLEDLSFDLDWRAPVGLPADTPARLRIVAEDLAGNRLEEIRPVRIGAPGQVSAVFERPPAGALFDTNERGERCIPVRILIDVGRGVGWAGVGLSNALLEVPRDEVAVEIVDGVIETCLVPREAGDDLRVLLRVQDVDQQWFPFASLPIAVPFAPSPPPWAPWQVLLTERPLDQLPRSSVPQMSFRAPRFVDDGFTVIRRDSRDNQDIDQVQIRRLTIDPVDARRIESAALLDLTEQLPGESRIGVGALGPIRPALTTVAGVDSDDRDCEGCRVAIVQVVEDAALTPAEVAFEYPADASRQFVFVERPAGLAIVERAWAERPPFAIVHHRVDAGWAPLGRLLSSADLLARWGDALITIDWDPALEAYVAQAWDAGTLEARGATPLITPGVERTRALLQADDGALAFAVVNMNERTLQRASLADEEWVVEPVIALPETWRGAPYAQPRLLGGLHTRSGSLLRMQILQDDAFVTIAAHLSADGALIFDGAWVVEDDEQFVVRTGLAADGRLIEVDTCRWNLVPRLCWRAGHIDHACFSVDPCVSARWDAEAAECVRTAICE